jgi:hypothetical protein
LIGAAAVKVRNVVDVFITMTLQAFLPHTLSYIVNIPRRIAWALRELE